MTVDNVKHEELITLTDARRASYLSSKYCAYTIKPVDITKQLQGDRWFRGFILTDVVTDCKVKSDPGRREDVAFVCFVEGDKYTTRQRKQNRDLPKLLAVRYFAMEPWYDYDMVVKWVKYLAGVIQEKRKDFTKVCWPVDEYDTPLQLILKENGFKYAKSYSSNSATLFNNGRYDEELGRMLFTLD